MSLAQTSSSTPTDVQSRPHMLAESAAFTDVVDALAPGSTWGARLTLGFDTVTRRGQLQRERIVGPGGMTNARCPGSTQALNGTGAVEYCDLAEYGHTTHTLMIQGEFALFHDISLHLGLPIILSDTRELTRMSSVSDATAILADGYSIAGTPTTLFSLNPNFRSPERSGIDQLRIGLNFDILAQSRDIHWPTWLVRLEYRAPIGPVMSPCDATSGLSCPVVPTTEYLALTPYTRPTEFNPPDSTNLANDTGYARPLMGTAAPGISRRMHGLYFLTAVSRRFGYVEPYIGMDALFEVPAGGEFFRFNDTPFGQLSTFPPIQGSVTAGVEVVPWENRENWQRFIVDARLRGQYYSQGRDFSPLYDALGTSNSIPLSSPTYAIRDMNNTSRPVYFLGTTGVHSHAAITSAITLSFQPARFLRFAVGGAFTFTTPYTITATDPCNPNVQPAMGRDWERGGCVGNAVPDPMHRPVIDSPGQRFRLVNDFSYNIFVNIIATPRFY